MSTIKMDKKNYGNQFFSGVAILAVSTFIVKLIGMFYKIPMMAYLGAEGMGYFNSAYEIYSLFFVVSTTGIPIAISILVSENKAKGMYKNIQRIYNISLSILTCLGTLGTLFMMIFHRQFAALINNNAAAYCILAISPAVVMICISSAIRGYFQGFQIMTPTAVSQIIEASGKLLLGLTFAIIAIKKGYDMSKVAAFAILGLTVGISLSLAYLILYRILFKFRKRSEGLSVAVDSKEYIIKNLLSIAIPITLSSTILNLTKLIDMTMVLSRLGYIGYTQEQANSIYGSYSTMAVSIFNLPSTLISAIALPLVPLLAGAIESKNKSKEVSVISISLKMTALISSPTGLGISVFSKPILSLLFSSQEREIEYTAPLLSLLGLSVFLSSMITITNAILQSYKQVKKPIISMIFGILVKVVLSFILIGIPEINIYGAPISTFFSTLMIVAVNMFFIIKQTAFKPQIFDLFGKAFIASAVSIIVGVSAYLLLNNYFDSAINILIVIIAVAIVYAITILKTKTIGPDEIKMLPQGDRIYKLLLKIHLA